MLIMNRPFRILRDAHFVEKLGNRNVSTGSWNGIDLLVIREAAVSIQFFFFWSKVPHCALESLVNYGKEPEFAVLYYPERMILSNKVWSKETLH